MIEPAVKSVMAEKGPDAIRDAEQVRLLATALSRLSAETLHAEMTNLPSEAREEAWILGAGLRDTLVALATDPAWPAPLQNDCFALPPGVHWTPVDEALAHLHARLAPVVGTQIVPLDAAVGRIAAASVTAKRSNPPLANTAVDLSLIHI